MQRILGYMRKAINEFGLIQDGDKVCVGVSGGKDSLVLLVGLHRLSSFIGIDFQVCGVTIDPGFGGREGDYSGVTEMCEKLGIELVDSAYIHHGKAAFHHIFLPVIGSMPATAYIECSVAVAFE